MEMASTKQALLDTLYHLYQNSYVKIATTTSVIVIGIYHCINIYHKKQERERRNSYPKDTVIIHQLPRGLRCPRFVRLFIC